jgi:rod shape-determining protein MreC
LLVGNNPYHSAAYFRTSNVIVANIYSWKKSVEQYFSLPGINQELANDNARLRELLAATQLPIIVNTKEDSSHINSSFNEYEYLAARVINNSTMLMHNYLTINKGKKNGLEPGMGVISADGIVGKVMSVSNNFATVASLLNTDVYVSAYLQRNKTFGSIHWDGSDILKTNLLYIPRHINLQVGDTIVTSGYNSIFPENIIVGFVDDFSLNETASWYDIDVNLSNDFSRLSYVYVIKNPKKEERVELETESRIDNEQ